MKKLGLCVALLALLGFQALAPVQAQAQSGGGYAVNWWTVDGGGGSSAGGAGSGAYVLSGTAGQADAGLLANGGYSVRGGYWMIHWQSLFLPLVCR